MSQRLEDLALALEVLIDRRRRVLDPLREPAHGEAFVSLVLEKLASGGKNPPAKIGFVEFAMGGGIHRKQWSLE